MMEDGRKVTEFVRSRLTEILPYVMDRYTTYTMIRDIEPFLDDNAENYGELIRSSSGTDAMVIGKVSDYNPSRVGFFIKCFHLESEQTLWTSEVEVKVSGATLNIEKAAVIAVEKAVEDLEAELGR